MASNQERPTITGTISSLYRGDNRALRVPRGPEDGQTVFIEVRRLKSCRYQRRTVTAEKVRPLAETIKQNGLLQNVTARPISGDPDHDYELIAGHRRTAAFRLLLEEAKTDEERDRWSRIPCSLKLGLSEVQVAALAAVENLERDDGDVLDQARSLLEVKKVGGFENNQQVAEATGMNVQRVTRLLRLAEAPEMMQKAVSPGVSIEVTDKVGMTRHQTVKLDLTVALAVVPYFRHQESALGRPEALAKTERLLSRIARGNWTRARVDAEVKRLLRSRQTAEVEADAEAETDELAVDPSAASLIERKLAFRDKGNQFIIYPNNLGTASADDKKTLLVRLRSFIGTLDGAGGPSSSGDTNSDVRTGALP